MIGAAPAVEARAVFEPGDPGTIINLRPASKQPLRIGSPLPEAVSFPPSRLHRRLLS